MHSTHQKCRGLAEDEGGLSACYVWRHDKHESNQYLSLFAQGCMGMSRIGHNKLQYGRSATHLELRGLGKDDGSLQRVHARVGIVLAAGRAQKERRVACALERQQRRAVGVEAREDDLALVPLLQHYLPHASPKCSRFQCPSMRPHSLLRSQGLRFQKGRPMREYLVQHHPPHASQEI